MAEDPPALEPGSKVGDAYEVVRLIGRGGFGEVWVAKHLRLPGKQVAIKVLHTRPGGISDNTLARFKREAEVATRIGHPNIVEVHDFNTLPSGAPYLVLEFLQGESLASRIRFGAMPLDEVISFIRQVGSALDASHSLGVVHRDLKPDNIFLVPTPMGTQVKVLDFGISKVVDSDTLQTADAVLVGTPQYMSPEQATGNNKEVGPQTDVFALASITYEMLSGAPPFTADSVAKVVFRIAYEPHVPLEKVKPGLPERVYAAVARGLEKDRTKRFLTIADFIAELTGQPVPRTLPPQTADGPAGGVARPDMATPESLGLAQTAAKPTPAAAAPVPAPPALMTPSATPAQSSRLMFGVVGLGLLVGSIATAAFLLMPPAPSLPPPPPPPPPVAFVAERANPPPKPAPEPEPAQPPVAAVAPEPPPAQVKAKAKTPKALSQSDRDALAEMEQRFQDDKAPLRRVQQKLGDISEDGLPRAYVIAGRAACKEKDLGIAVKYLQRIEERSLRRELIAECKKLGMELTE